MKKIVKYSVLLLALMSIGSTLTGCGNSTERNNPIKVPAKHKMNLKDDAIANDTGMSMKDAQKDAKEKGFSVFALNSITIKKDKTILKYQRDKTEFTNESNKNAVKFVGNVDESSPSYVVSDGHNFVVHNKTSIDSEHPGTYTMAE